MIVFALKKVIQAAPRGDRAFSNCAAFPLGHSRLVEAKLQRHALCGNPQFQALGLDTLADLQRNPAVFRKPRMAFVWKMFRHLNRTHVAQTAMKNMEDTLANSP